MVKNYYRYIFIGFMAAFIFQAYGLSVKIFSEQESLRFSVTENQTIHTGTDAYIRKITDGNRIYILKQINDSSIDEQFLLINDCIASTIGFESGVPVNEVFFIPYNVGSHLKKYPERAATLHCVVSGKDLESAFPQMLPSNFSLHQRVVNPNSPWQKKKLLPDNQQGCSKLIIESMSFHRDLPAIVAFDCFVGNSDRSNPNLFYNPQTDSFYGIDHAAAFSKKLPLFACDRLKELICLGYFDACSTNVFYCLRQYRNILRKLHDCVQPCQIMESMRKLSSLLACKALLSNQIIERISYHYRVVTYNYLQVKELLNLLDQFLC